MIELTCSAPAVPFPTRSGRAHPRSSAPAGNCCSRAAAIGVGANALTVLLITHVRSDNIADLGDVTITG